jgi:hypothetical protein
MQGYQEGIQGPVERKKSPPPSKGGGLKIFILNRKDWLSVAERLWFGLKELIYALYKY